MLLVLLIGLYAQIEEIIFLSLGVIPFLRCLFFLVHLCQCLLFIAVVKSMVAEGIMHLLVKSGFLVSQSKFLREHHGRLLLLTVLIFIELPITVAAQDSI